MLTNPASIARRLILGTGFAIALTACSQVAPPVETTAAETTAAETTAAEIASTEPASTEPTSTEPTSTETATAEDIAASTGLTLRTVDAAPAHTGSAPVAPAADLTPVTQACFDEEHPTAVLVAATTGLNVRQSPGTHHPVIDHLAENELADVAYWADNFGCVYVEGSGVWWAVSINNHETIGWSHAGYLIEVVLDNNEDMSVDCEILPNNECVAIVYTASEIYFDVVPDEATIVWAQIGCIYDGNDNLCAALADIGYQDPGNGFFQAPTEALEADCSAGDPNTDPIVAMSCAELLARG